MTSNYYEYLAKTEIIKVLSDKVDSIRCEMKSKISYHGEDFSTWPEWAKREYETSDEIALKIVRFISTI